MIARTYFRKFGAPMTNTTTEKLGAKRSRTYQRLHLSIPQKGRAEKPPKMIIMAMIIMPMHHLFNIVMRFWRQSEGPHLALNCQRFWRQSERSFNVLRYNLSGQFRTNAKMSSQPLKRHALQVHRFTASIVACFTTTSSTPLRGKTRRVPTKEEICFLQNMFLMKCSAAFQHYHSEKQNLPYSKTVEKRKMTPSLSG